MIKAILVGCCGKMGGNITNCANNDGQIKIAAGVDKINTGKDYPVFSDFNDIMWMPTLLLTFPTFLCLTVF